jgi:outer membrane protein insertion porin family
VLLLCVMLLSPADAVWAETAPAERIVPVVVALEPFAPVEAADPEWLSRFVRALESTDPESPLALQVNEAVTLEHSLLGDPRGVDSQLQLQQKALLTGSSYLVIGKITRLAQHYSLDVRVLGAAELKVLAHLVYEGEGPGGFAAAIDEAAAAVRDILGRQVAPAVEGERRASARADFGPDVEEITPAGVNTVVEVRVRGNRRIEADAIRAVVGTRVGEPLRGDRIGEDVRRIYKLGFFRDVQVEATDELEGKLVTFVVEENPIIRRVSVSGNESVGSSDIKDQLTLTVGSTVDYPLLLENQARIEALYKVQGFHLVKVSYGVESLGQDSVAINYDISEGGKLRLTQIEFEGNESLSDDELLKVAQTKPWGWKSYVTHFWDKSGVYAEPIFYQDLDRVSRRYMDDGFIRANISDPEVIHDKDGLRVKVRITEGPRYVVGDVDVIGDESMDRDELWGLLELVEGDVFNRSTLTDDVERLRARYADRGFFSARVTPRTRVDDEARAVDCAFAVEKGSLYFVDRIEVHGNTRTRDGVIRRELGLGEGELYSANALRRSQARVRRLGFFEEVDLETKPLEEANRVAVDVDVVERPTGSFSFGAGVGSTDGFLMNASLRQDNLFGKGYGLHANVDFGSENANMFLRFTDPYFLGSPAGLSATFSRTDREYVDFDQENMGFNFNVSYPLDEGETRVGSGYSFSKREITGVEEFQASSLLQREEFQGSSDTSMMTLSMVRDTRDDIRFPRSGQVSGFAVDFAGLGGLNQFLRIEGRTTWFLPAKRWLGFDSTFVVNSRFGWAIPFNDISDFDLPGCSGDPSNPNTCAGFVALDPDQIQGLSNIDTDLELPLTERYFLGGLGAFQVRGFKQRSLGPRRTILDRQSTFGNGDVAFFPSRFSLVDPGGCLDGPGTCNDLDDVDIDDFEELELADVIGGNKMFLLNLELQFPISEELGLRGILFFDMGNAFAENEAINPADFRFGAGGGLQWFSPFGPILVQLGFPLDKLEDEDGSVFEFSFGGSQF